MKPATQDESPNAIRKSGSWRVVIRSGAKAGEWGTYATIEQAAAVAAKLRKHGMDATVVEVVR